MKKRLKKKLGLHRETLRKLGGDQLGKVAGARACTLEDDTTCVCTADCNSGGTGGSAASCGCSGPHCPTNTWLDLTCCDC